MCWISQHFKSVLKQKSLVVLFSAWVHFWAAEHIDQFWWSSWDFFFFLIPVCVKVDAAHHELLALCALLKEFIQTCNNHQHHIYGQRHSPSGLCLLEAPTRINISFLTYLRPSQLFGLMLVHLFIGASNWNQRLLIHFKCWRANWQQ